MNPLLRATFSFVCLVASSRAAITINGAVDKTKYDNAVTFTVTADPAAATTTATLDGVAVPIGSAVAVTAVSYHELRAESRDAGGALVDTEVVRFIVRNTARGSTEDGIPTHTPFKMVNDAPSAFAAGTLQIIAPAAWPVGLPVPIAAVLRDGANEPLWLNGVVSLGSFPKTTLPLRRGWGSVLAPAATNAGTVVVAATVNGLAHNPAITFEAAPVFTTLSGTIASNTTFPPNSRLHVTGTLTINAGATLTIGAGSIVKVSTGTATNGTGAEIVVNGTLQVNGANGSPVVFAPDTPGAHWGGIELPAATSLVNAAHTIFTGAGEDEDWFDNDGGYGGSSHRAEQALFLIVGSGSGTNVGARLQLTECYCFNLAGQVMNSKTNTGVELSRTLYQRAITSGELNGSKVTIDRSALIEFPGETDAFVDGDNDGIYLTNGELAISNTVIGFCKDDGVDSGADGGDNPYTAATDVTPLVHTNNWFEGTFHEGNSLSGTRNVSYAGCVFVNCGQGVEAGYSASSTGDGPNAIADGCVFAGNMVGARWGDNYGSSYNYNASFEVKNSLLLHNRYRDAFSGQWHPTQAHAWLYQTTALNTFGRPYFNVHDNRVTQYDAVNHPTNVAWNPAADGALLAPFMPVPGSNVGVAISSYAPAQPATSAYPGAFTVRLSTFSALPASVTWAVKAKVDTFGESETILASGALTFTPGEMFQTIAAPVASPGNYALIHVDLANPVNAEVTGEAWYFTPPATPPPTLVATASSGWRYRETRSEPPAAWKELAFDDTTAEWLPATLPVGFGVSGVTYGTTVAGGSSTDRTKAFYFRRKFTVANPAQITALTFRVRRDDAVVAWLNNPATPSVVSADGTFNPPYSYDATTLASGNVPNSTNTGVYLSYAVPVAQLVAGENILAVQLHQTSITSSDLLLDCELTATYAPPFELRATKSGAQQVLWWFDADAQLEQTTDFNTWTPVPGASSPLPFTPSGAQRFFRLRR